jgi:hypothetical protein
MYETFLIYARSAWSDVRQLKGRYPWLLLICCILPFLIFELVPSTFHTLQMVLYLAGTVGTTLACTDLLMLMRRVYVHRGDMAPLRWPILLISSFAILLCAGRIVRFISFFISSLYVSETIITLVSAGILLVTVLSARSAELYLLHLPRLADLKAASDEAHDATSLLQLREEMALEAMLESAEDTVLKANRWAYRILEYDSEKHELLGKRLHQLIHEDDHQKVYSSIQQNYINPYIVRAITKSGGIKHIQMVGTHFLRTLNAADLHDSVYVSSFRDVSVERHYLLELERRRSQPEDALNQISSQLAELRSYFYPPVDEPKPVAL